MIILLLIVPLLAASSALLLYRHNGKREILRFDTVQFINSFLIAPIFFVWMKSFLFYLLRKEFELRLGLTELFVADTIFSVLGMFIYGFVVIHSLTASFKLKRVDDPLYDLFKHSEYFHLWLSHLVIYSGAMILMTSLAMVNIFSPLLVEPSKNIFYPLLLASYIFGILSYIGVWLSDPKQANFMRIMKLLFALFFLIHVVAYFVFDPGFSLPYAMYWVSFMVFMALVTLSPFVDRSERALNFFERFKYKNGWDFRVELFKK